MQLNPKADARKFDSLIFDMDGTLVDSSPEILKCLKKSYIDAGVSVDGLEFGKSLVGPPIRQIIARLTPSVGDADADRIVSRFRLNYDNSADDASELYAGVRQMLEFLKSGGTRIFVATNKPKIPTLRLVKSLGLDFFDGIYTIDKFGARMSKREMISAIIEAYGLDASKSAMAGDSVDDLESAKAGDITAIGALWGYGKKEDLIAAADVAFESVADLFSMLKNSR